MLNRSLLALILCALVSAQDTIPVLRNFTVNGAPWLGFDARRNATTSIINLSAGRCLVANEESLTSAIAASTVTATVGTGNALIGCHEGLLKVGTATGLTVTCSACTIVTDTNSWPAEWRPLYVWNASAGPVWGATAAHDLRVGFISPPTGASTSHITYATDSQGRLTFSPASTMTLDSEVHAAYYAPDSGSTDAYVASYSNISCPLAYIPGLQVLLKPGTVNTDAASLNLCGLGVVNIKKSDGTTDPDNGQIADETPVMMIYDGTVFRLPPAAAAPFTHTSKTVVIPAYLPATAPSQTNVATANRIYLTKFCLDVPASFAEIAVYINTSTATHWNAGVYSLDGATKYIDAGDQTSAAGGQKVSTPPFAVTLAAGCYLAGIALDNNTVQINGYSVSGNMIQVVADSSAAGGIHWYADSWAGTGALPTTITPTTFTGSLYYPLFALRP